MPHINLSQKFTQKDKTIIIIFILLIIIVSGRHLFLESFNIDAMINQTMLLMISFVGFINMAYLLDWSIVVPDFYEARWKQRQETYAQNYMRAYFEEDKNFIQNYGKERIAFLVSQLGVNSEQLDEIRLGIIRMRSMPLCKLEDAREKIAYLLKQSAPSVVIDQRKIDSAALSYTDVQYYVNFTDMMFLPDFASELSSILSFLITETTKEELKSIDKIVIPHDSNFLLGVEVGKKLGKPVVKMRHTKGKIISDQCWEGNLGGLEKVIIIHDVLVSGGQIINTLGKLFKTCTVVGLFCLIVRKGHEGLECIERKKIPVYRIIDLDDNDIHALRGEK